jgi:hypothetical protein
MAMATAGETDVAVEDAVETELSLCEQVALNMRLAYHHFRGRS